MTRRQFLLLVVPLLAVLLGFGLLLVLDGHLAAQHAYWDGDLSHEVRKEVALRYPAPLDKDLQERAYFNAMSAYLQTIDPYSNLVPPWQLDEEKRRSFGSYAGIGVRIQIPRSVAAVDSLLITGVQPGGPADDAGVRIGDRIRAVDGRSIQDLTRGGNISAVNAAIQGQEGTEVALLLGREAGREQEVAVKRGRISTGSVRGVRMVDEEHGIGYVRLASFHTDTAKDFKVALATLVERGMQSLVLDLRENKGGLLEQAVEVADAFLKDGVVVRVVGRTGNDEEHRSKAGDGASEDLPLVVLVNRNSASASEVVAGALQDYRRASIVGVHTYGKFKVQTLRDLQSEAGDCLLRLTTAVYLTPAGRFQTRSLHNGSIGGLEPDLLVPVTQTELRSLNTLFAEEEQADWNPNEPPDYAGHRDRQLEAGVALLRREPYYPDLVSTP